MPPDFGTENMNIADFTQGAKPIASQPIVFHEITLIFNYRNGFYCFKLLLRDNYFECGTSRHT